MKDMKRASRRHHTARLKRARGHHWGRDIRHEQKLLGKVIDTPTPCSCWMCGNPRRYFKVLTRQERRAIDRERSGYPRTDLPILGAAVRPSPSVFSCSCIAASSPYMRKDASRTSGVTSRRVVGQGIHGSSRIRMLDISRTHTREVNRRQRCRRSRPHLQSHVFSGRDCSQDGDLHDPCVSVCTSILNPHHPVAAGR